MKKLIAFVFIISVNLLFAQGEAALPFLYSQQSPLYLGAGNIGVSNPIDEQSGFYYNPSLLGYTSKVNHASFFSIPKQDFNSYYLTPTFSNYGFNLGYNLEDANANLPFTIGLGFLHHKFSFGTFYRTSAESPEPIGEFESYDSYNSLSLGIGFEYVLQFNIGMSIKFIDSQLSDKPTENEQGTGSADITVFDYGASINLPVSKLLLRDLKYHLDKCSYIYPVANLSLGASLLNYGDEIKYVDDVQSAPLPRTSRIGYTLNIGTGIKLKSGSLNLFSYYFSSESEDILIKREGLGSYEYQSPFSDMRFPGNLIEQKDDENIVVHKGHIIDLFETIKITSGQYKGRGFTYVRKSNGYAVSSKGFMNLLSMLVDNSTIRYINDHIVLNYYNSRINVDTSYESEYDGLSIIYKGFVF